MKRVSVRTLLLLVELLIAVTAYQFLVRAAPVQASAVWLDDDSDEPVDPNVPDEPENPEPEAAAGWSAARHL